MTSHVDSPDIVSLEENIREIKEMDINYDNLNESIASIEQHLQSLSSSLLDMQVQSVETIVALAIKFGTKADIDTARLLSNHADTMQFFGQSATDSSKKQLASKGEFNPAQKEKLKNSTTGLLSIDATIKDLDIVDLTV